MSIRAVILLVAVVAITAGGVAYTAGVAAGRAAPIALTMLPPKAQPVQLPQDQFPFPLPIQPQVPGQSPAPGQVPGQIPGQVPPLREFIPIPGPGDQDPGQRQQNPLGECEPIILLYKDGQLFQLRPGPGPRDGQGRPGTPPEFFYLNPYQGPPIPGFPMPRPDRGPGFSPVNPRS